MTSAQQKHLLRMECACDRLEFTVAAKRSTTALALTAPVLASGYVGRLVTGFAGTVLPALIPRKWRWLRLGFRIWRGIRNS